MLHGDGEGVLVETDLRVGQILVVDEHEVGLGLAHQLGHLGAHAVDVDLDAVVAHELAAVQVVEADRQAVRADGRVLGVSLLQHGERRDRARVVGLEDRTKGVHTGGLEPQLRPAGQLAAAGLLQLGEQVAQLGVAVLVLLEVRGDTGHELLETHPGDELLEHRAALGVGDAVEVDLNILEVVDGRDDGVGGRQLVLAVGPGLLHGVEGRPGLVPFSGLSSREGRCPLGKRLIEPEVVPPLHGDEVAEPHVGELVEDRDDPALLDGVGHLRAEDVGLRERDRARVLHGARVELGHEELVVLLERVRVGEVLLVEREALAGLLEDVVGVQELAQ